MKKVLKGLKGIGINILKVVDNVALGGVVMNKTEEIITQDFLNDRKLIPNGQVDWQRWIVQVVSSTIPVLLLISLICGWLTIEQIKDFIKAIGFEF